MLVDEFLNGWGVYINRLGIYAQHVNSSKRVPFASVVAALDFATTALPVAVGEE